LLVDLGRSQQRWLVGEVAGGDWDLPQVRLDALPVFESVFERVVDRVPWEGTRYYMEARQAIERGEPFYKITTNDDLERVLARTDSLIASMARDGFRSQEELQTGRGWDEIITAIDRDGHIVFVDGRHRLAVARALGIERVPTVVAVRHRSWVQLKQELLVHGRQHGGRLYQPMWHPDLRAFSSKKGHERFELIHDALPMRVGTLLDIGANSGYFSQRFADVGFDCTALERSQREAYFLRKLRDAGGYSFRVVEGSLCDLDTDTFDVVLALNVFHHFLKSETAFSELSRFLERLTAQALVLECHLADDPQMANAYRNFAPDEFAGFVAKTGRFARCRRIGEAADRRPLFLLDSQTANPIARVHGV
jgi:SAM-dependent methyltransferase